MQHNIWTKSGATSVSELHNPGPWLLETCAGGCTAHTPHLSPGTMLGSGTGHCWSRRVLLEQPPRHGKEQHVPGWGHGISPPGLLHPWEKCDRRGGRTPYFKRQGLSQANNFPGLIEHAICLLVKPVFGLEDLLLLAMMNVQEQEGQT